MNMKNILLKIKNINWRQGNGVLLVSVAICLLCLTFIFLLIENNEVFTIAAVAQTRADAIADSSGAYAVMYDYEFNAREAYEMASLLSSYNNSEKKPISTEVELEQDGDGRNVKMTVTVKAESGFYFFNINGDNRYRVKRESVVQVVDPWQR